METLIDIASVVTAVGFLITVGMSVQVWREQRKPRLIVGPELDQRDPSYIYLGITNTGIRPAMDVECQIAGNAEVPMEPPLRVINVDVDHITNIYVGPRRHILADIQTGQKHRVFLGRYETLHRIESLRPPLLVVNISYGGNRICRPKSVTYRVDVSELYNELHIKEPLLEVADGLAQQSLEVLNSWTDIADELSQYDRYTKTPPPTVEIHNEPDGTWTIGINNVVDRKAAKRLRKRKES